MLIKSTYNLVVLGLLLSLSFSCKQDKSSTSEERADTSATHDKTVRVEVTKPALRSFTADFLISGKAIPNREVTIHAMESGFVKKVYKDIGDRVGRGGTIALLENPNLLRQKQEASALMEAKRSVYDRLQSTYEKTPALTPLQVLENAKGEYLSAKAKYDAVADRINFLTIKAPFGGIITKRLVDEGALVQSGIDNSDAKPLFEIQETHPVRISVPLAESEANNVKVGQAAIVNFTELAGESFQVKVARTSGVLDQMSNTMIAEFDIPNSKGRIKPGMFAKVHMQLGNRDNVLSLPVTSQMVIKNQPFLLTVKNGRIVHIPLKKGLANKDYFEVLNADVTEETLIVTQGKGLVSEGQLVEAVLNVE